MFMKLVKFAIQSIGLLFLSCSCISSSPEGSQRERLPEDWAEVASSKVLAERVRVRDFDKIGPFQSKVFPNFTIPISPTNRINTDLYLSKHDSQAPLIIFVHGNKFSKLVHQRQAKHLASWGFNCLVLDLPNQKRWIENGRSIGELTMLIDRYPAIVDRKIKHKGIFLIGHSFGGSAISIAAGRGAPVRGIILLDPAIVANSVKKYLRKIESPAVILGADRRVFRSRKRATF